MISWMGTDVSADANGALTVRSLQVPSGGSSPHSTGRAYHGLQLHDGIPNASRGMGEGNLEGTRIPLGETWK
jgi:hypothetical protein